MQKLIKSLQVNEMSITGYIMLYCIAAFITLLIVNIFFINQITRP